jgi:hypothetical protein
MAGEQTENSGHVYFVVSSSMWPSEVGGGSGRDGVALLRLPSECVAEIGDEALVGSDGRGDAAEKLRVCSNKAFAG